MTRAHSDAGMVERGARQIYERRNGHGCTSWSRLPQSHKEPYRGDMIAALDTLQDPTPGMVKAGVDLALKVSLGGDYHWPQYLRDVWRTMHAAALRDGEG